MSFFLFTQELSLPLGLTLLDRVSRRRRTQRRVKG